MSRPIIMTDEMKKSARSDFETMLTGLKMLDGKLSYSKSFTYKNSKAVVRITHQAYRKIIALVTEFSDEVAWHGTVTRSSENEFIIDDILVYPQVVTGCTVNTDQVEYSKWLYSVDDEVFNKIRMQGHSHVNMGVSPSGIDDNHRQQILEQLEPDMFYIFMIWNKSLAIHTLIYDMQRNVLYENKDVEIKLTVNDEVAELLADARGKVQKRKLQKSKKQVQQSFEFSEYYSQFHAPFDLGGESWR